MKKALLPYLLCLLLLFSCGDNGSESTGGNNANGRNTIKGTVLDANLNAPIPQALIKTNPASGTVLTDNNGNFEIPVDDAGYYQVLASKEGYYQTSEDIKVTSGKVANVTILMKDLQSGNHVPETPSLLNPDNNTTISDTSIVLSWSCSDQDGDKLSYDIYLDETKAASTKLGHVEKDTTFAVDNLKDSTKYYWKVVAKDQYGETTSSVWSFTVNKNSTGPIDNKEGLVAYYPFNGDANDKAGKSYNGTPKNISYTYDRNNKANSAVLFRGDTTSYITVPYSTPFNLQNMTIAAWIKPGNDNGIADYNSMVDIISRWGATGYGYQSFTFGVTKSNYLFVYTYDGSYSSQTYSNSTIYTNAWTHIAFTRQNGYIYLYINGYLSYYTSSNTPQSSTCYLYMGGKRAYGKSTAFNGALDEVYIYNRALADYEIRELYQK